MGAGQGNSKDRRRLKRLEDRKLLKEALLKLYPTESPKPHPKERQSRKPFLLSLRYSFALFAKRYLNKTLRILKIFLTSAYTILSVVSVCLTLWGIVYYYPRFSIQSGASLNPDRPFETRFEIENQSPYTIYHISRYMEYSESDINGDMPASLVVNQLQPYFDLPPLETTSVNFDNHQAEQYLPYRVKEPILKIWLLFKVCGITFNPGFVFKGTLNQKGEYIWYPEGGADASEVGHLPMDRIREEWLNSLPKNGRPQY